ncbi:methionine--tRNA ligase [candidate division KSB1 bacterium]
MNLKKQKILVTSALPYANGPIHLGHLAGAYLPADVFVRYNRLKGNDVVYICGSDEHGVPITLRAEAEGVTPQEIVDKYHEMNKLSFKKVGISFDNFSRTTLPLHHETSKEFFLKIHDKDILRSKTDTQFFCSKCDRFLADRFVEGKCPNCENIGARGDQCEKCGTWLDPTKLIEPQCKICGSKPFPKETTHWYIPLGDFQKKLEKWILSKKDWKENVLNFCKGWFDQGLDDRAVTRDLEWGVHIPLEGSEGKVLYVWFDAPIGYISSTKEWASAIGKPDIWKEYWCNPDSKIYHFIGKDNIVFHAIFFPVILMAYGEGYNLPENVVANEFLNLESRKISTSQNYAVWLDDFLEKFPPDPLRYCLASIAPESKDSDFSWRDFQARNNNELADVLGNFINRSLVFIYKNFNGKIPAVEKLSPENQEFLSGTDQLLDEISNKIEKFQVKAGLNSLMEIARRANKYFNDSEPWISLKEDKKKCSESLFVCAQIVKSLSLAMLPFLPFSGKKLIQILNMENEFEGLDWDGIKEMIIPSGKTINKPEILFYKLEDEVIQMEIEKLDSTLSGNESSGEKEEKKEDEKVSNIISIDDFKNLDLRIAEIKSAAKVPKTDKLLRLEVDDGKEIRFIVSGIAEHYTEEELVGKSIVLLANLKPAKIRGEISNGMLLAAGTDDKLALLMPDKPMPPGSSIT